MLARTEVVKWPSEIPTDVELTNEVKVTVPSILAQHKNYGVRLIAPNLRVLPLQLKRRLIPDFQKNCHGRYEKRTAGS